MITFAYNIMLKYIYSLLRYVVLFTNGSRYYSFKNQATFSYIEEKKLTD